MIIRIVFVILNFLLISNGDEEVQKHDPDFLLTAKELIVKYGYPYEEYTVQTEDGYLLTLQRIPHGRKNQTTPNKHSVLLMPGLLCDSAIYVSMAQEGSLAFILADNGFDVWLGNYRGSTLSRKHISLNPDSDKTKYWDFSFHEIGFYDTPAFVDHILNITKTNQIFYGGHSQGGTSYLIMLSEKPQYAEKIKFGALISPAFIIKNAKSPVVRFAARHYQLLQAYGFLTHNFEVAPLSIEFAKLVGRVCDEKSNMSRLCVDMLCLAAGWTPNQINAKRLPIIASNTPSGSSLKQFLHFLQLRSGEFRQFDYGEKENKKIYGQEIPPEYSVKKIKSLTGLYHGDTDWLTDAKDIELLGTKLPNLYKRKIYAGLNHADVLWGIDAPKTVLKDVVQDMKSRT